tara:strand:+ start:491 stop:667 length:177 start_codon:yes stop_codon:yes gene_type:complete
MKQNLIRLIDTMRLTLHRFHLWRLNRMMIKSIKLDQQIDALSIDLEAWEKQTLLTITT